jgi:hypothetical protein
MGYAAGCRQSVLEAQLSVAAAVAKYPTSVMRAAQRTTAIDLSESGEEGAPTDGGEHE